MLQKSNAKSYAVLSILIDKIEFPLDDYSIEAYENGREHGFAVSLFKDGTKVVFAENRNSDSIVVYFGKSTDFSMQGNTPNEKIYKAAMCFSYESYLEAAKFCLEHLNKGGT